MMWNTMDKTPEIGYNKDERLIVTTSFNEVMVYNVARDGYGKLHWNASITHEGKYSFDSEIGTEYIKAWMYMPEAYKEEE